MNNDEVAKQLTALSARLADLSNKVENMIGTTNHFINMVGDLSAKVSGLPNPGAQIHDDVAALYQHISDHLDKMEQEIDSKASKEDFQQILEFLERVYPLHKTVEDEQLASDPRQKPVI